MTREKEAPAADQNAMFVWRDNLRFSWTGNRYRDGPPDFDVPVVYAQREEHCPFCKLNWPQTYSHDGRVMRCAVCGFHFSRHSCDYDDDPAYEFDELELAVLRRFDVNSCELALEELGSHLRRRYSDVYVLSPRRFEELIADAYRNLGFAVKLTKISRDGGVDLYLLDNDKTLQIVECKRYAQNRAITIGLVHRLLGVQLEKGIRRAQLVTTSRFTRPAKDVASRLNEGHSGYFLALLDAQDLLQSVECYNLALPPLTLDPRLCL